MERLLLLVQAIFVVRTTLTGETPIPDTQYAAVKTKNNPQVKTKYADILARSWKAKLELLTAVEKSSICFLCVSCVKNARQTWVSLKEQYKLSTVAEELQLVKKFNAMKLGAVWKNLVERFCILLELVHARPQELGIEILEKHFILQVLRNLPKEYNIQCQVMRIELSARKLTIQGMYV